MLPLLYFHALGWVLVFTHGHYAKPFVLALTAIHAVFTALALMPARGVLAPPASGAQRERTRLLLIVGLLLGFSLLLIYNPQLLYPTNAQWRAELVDLLVWLPIATALLLVPASLIEQRWAKVAFFVGAAAVVGVLIGARVMTLYASPTPRIDVFTTSVAAVKYFLQGLNPYAQSYVDIYRGAYDYAPAFPYWPGYLLWASLWAKLFGGAHDVRASLLIAEVLTALVFVGWARSLRLSWTTAVGAAALWLSFPVDLFVLEQAWIDPLLVLAFAAAAWALTARKWILAGALLGFACAVKQYAGLGALLVLAWSWRNFGWRVALKGTLGGLGAFLVLVLPFALWDWTAFYNSSVRQWAEAQPRLDSLAFVAWLARKLELAPGPMNTMYGYFTLATLAIFAGMLVWVARRPGRTLRDVLAATTISYGWMLLFAKQSFCNYYYFLSFFIAGAALAEEGLRAQDPSVAAPAPEPVPEQPAAPSSTL